MRMNAIWRLFVVSLLFPTVNAAAQSSASGTASGADCTPLPAIKPGAWVVIDRTGVKLRSTVTEVSETRITLRRESLSGINSDNGTDSVTREWGVSSGPAASNPNVTLGYTPSLDILKFPLCVGNSHEQKISWQTQGGYSNSGAFTLKSRVAAKENIAIGGKDFEVFRVEYDTGSQGGSIWYSPALGRAAKFVSKTTSWLVVEHGGM